MDVEPEEVDQFAGSVDFCLVDALALPKHGGRVERVAVRACDEVGCAKENGSPIREVHRSPLSFGLLCSLDRLFDFIGSGLMYTAEEVLMVVGGHHFRGGSGIYGLPPNEGRNFDGLIPEFL
jgi:hypothetical protein